MSTTCVPRTPDLCVICDGINYHRCDICIYVLHHVSHQSKYLFQTRAARMPLSGWLTLAVLDMKARCCTSTCTILVLLLLLTTYSPAEQVHQRSERVAIPVVCPGPGGGPAGVPPAGGQPLHLLHHSSFPVSRIETVGVEALSSWLEPWWCPVRRMARPSQSTLLPERCSRWDFL